MSIYGNPVMLGGSGGGGGGGIRLLQYIASTGAGEYIDTGYIVTNDTVLISTLNVDSNNPVWAAPYGVMEGGGIAECIFYVKNNGNDLCFFCWGGGSTSYSFTNYYGKDVTVRHYKGKGQVFSGKNAIDTNFSPSGSASTTYPIYLFTTNDRGSAITTSHICKMKLYGFDIYEDTTLTRMFRPALDSVGTPGLYEFITGTFFYNQGDGGFLYPT